MKLPANHRLLSAFMMLYLVFRFVMVPISITFYAMGIFTVIGALQLGWYPFMISGAIIVFVGSWYLAHMIVFWKDFPKTLILFEHPSSITNPET